MEPITREEYYLAKIAGTYEGKTPKPVTNDEYYLATMAGDYSGNTPQPVTRLQYYMAKVAGVWDGSIPAPVTRLEYYWAAIANGEGEVFPPVTREEHFLTLVADAYSVVLTVVTGNPALLEGVKGNRFTSLTLHGKSTQGSTTGANLLPFEVGKKDADFEVFEDGIELSVTQSKDIYAIGRMPANSESAYDDFSLLAPGKYYVYSDSANVPLYIVAWRKGTNVTLGYSVEGVAREVEVMDGDKFRIFLRAAKDFKGKVKAIISKTQPTASNYEPYTGGKPSPSPEYPQEIESVGDVGKITLNVLGKNLIPFKEIPKSTNKGITITTKSNGIVHFEGTATAAYDSPIISLQGVSLPKGRYLIYPASSNTIMLHVVVKKMAGNRWYYHTIVEIEDGDELLYCYFTINKGATVNEDAYFYMQIDNGGTLSKSDFEPYKPAQTLIIPTPNGLPGIPVSSGGNYTDEKGQQWVCNEIDLAKGEMVQWISKIVVDGEKMKFVHAPNTVFWNLPRETSPGCISNFKYTSRYFNDRVFNANNAYDFVFTTSTAMKPYFDTVEELNAFCVQKNSEGNPLTIYYCIETPIRTTLLSETIAAYKALKTYSPTTTVINDAGAGMSVGYKKAK